MNVLRHPRRDFLKQSLLAGTALAVPSLISSVGLSSCRSSRPGGGNYDTSFEQSKLPYEFSALEPVIDTQTMDIHYNKHAGAYATNLREAAATEGIDMKRPLEEVFDRISKHTAKLRNNAGGHYNHEMFWKSMIPEGKNGEPSQALRTALESSFGSLGSAKMQFNEAAKNRFGSGWAWLYVDRDKRLRIGSTPNQDNPLMDVSEIKGYPILGLDVWEHAYYLKYQNRRADYIDSWWKVVNWEYVSQRYGKAMG